MTPALKALAPVDFAVIAAYMALMLAIGVYAMRFNRGASDYFKGGSRIHWLAAGLSSFMSGFSAWTFTGAAGLAYEHGLVAILLYVGNACTFLLGYFLFAAALAARPHRHRHGVPGGPLRRAHPPGLLVDHDPVPVLHRGQHALRPGAVRGPDLRLAAVVGDRGLGRRDPRLLRDRRAVGRRDHRLPAGGDPDAVHARDGRRLAGAGGRALGARLPPAAGDDVAQPAARVRLELRRVLGGDDELRLQHRGHGPALLQRGGRARLEEDRAALLRPVPGGLVHLVHSALRHARAAPGPALRSGPGSPTRKSRPTRSRRSRCCRAASWGSCWPRCSAPPCRASRVS